LSGQTRAYLEIAGEVATTKKIAVLGESVILGPMKPEEGKLGDHY